MTRRKSARKVPNKTCKEITNLVLDYLTDKLTPAVKRDFTRHLRSCPDCVSFLNTYKKTVTATGTIRPEEVPLEMRENVLAFLRKRIHRVGQIFLIALAQLSSLLTAPHL